MMKKSRGQKFESGIFSKRVFFSKSGAENLIILQNFTLLYLEGLVQNFANLKMAISFFCAKIRKESFNPKSRGFIVSLGMELDPASPHPFEKTKTKNCFF